MRHLTRLSLASSLLLSACAANPTPHPAGPAAATGGFPDAGGGGGRHGDAAAADDVGADWTPPEPTLWPERPAFVPAGTFYDAHPEALARVSQWVTHVAGPVAERPGVAYRGGYGIGNGWTFGLLGLTDPLNTLHGLTTPTYERGDRFFGDYALYLVPAGADSLSHFDEEWATWSLSAPVVLTRGVVGALRLDTWDFAPESEDPVLRACVVRVLEVTNDGAEESAAHELRVVPANPVSSPGVGQLVEVTKERTLSTAFAAPAQGEVVGNRLVLSIGPLAAGESTVASLLHCGAAGADPAPLPEAVDPGALLDETAAVFGAWAGELVQVEVPDPLVADFLDGMKMTLRAQTSAGGASCPMSQYTRTWARDNIGPALALLALGAHDDVAAMMDYVYGATLLGGDFSNSYDADLDLSDLPSPPDWDAKPPLSGPVASETPSYMVWMYGAWERHTGLTGRAADRWGWLRRALLAQGFDPATSKLPFTGDETFRAAMNAAFGFDLEHPHKTESWSANSTLLWLGAAEHFARLAGLLGHGDDAEAAAERRVAVDASLTQTYLLDDGCVSAFQVRESGEVWPAPFEDVALKLTWAGARAGDDPMALDALACHIERLGTTPGRFQSPLHEDYAGSLVLPVDGPVYTGMLPGYGLAALTASGHPDAEAAFEVVGQTLGSSGNLQEYQVATDDSGLTILYDASGVLTDYTAKFRPWEGGIVAEAVLRYLLGYAPDATGDALALRPHLPNDWPSMAFRGLRLGPHRLDVAVERAAAGVAVTVTSHASVDLSLGLRCDDASGLELAGAPVAAEELTARDHFGVTSWERTGLSLPAGQAVELLCVD